MSKLRVMENMVRKHNENHPNNGILTVRQEYYTNTYSIGLGMCKILEGLSESEAFFVIAGINNYADAQ